MTEGSEPFNAEVRQENPLDYAAPPGRGRAGQSVDQPLVLPEVALHPKTVESSISKFGSRMGKRQFREQLKERLSGRSGASRSVKKIVLLIGGAWLKPAFHCCRDGRFNVFVVEAPEEETASRQAA